VAVSEPPVTEPPENEPALKVPPEIVAPLIVELQSSAPVALVTVQPVEPLPPPSRMLPVEVPPIPIVLAPLASTVRAPVPEIAVPDTFSEFTAVPVRVPPETEPPDRVPPEIVAVLIVEAVVTAPDALTLKTLVPLLRKSARLPLAAPLELLTYRSAWPAVGLAELLTARVLLVPALDRLSTPAAPALELVRPSSVPR
jgi:hypothetical protein